MAVQNGDVDRAVVPIENSLEGCGGATLDALAGDAADVRIAGEVVHPIHHCLVAARRAGDRGHRRGWSRTRRPARQCARFLRERLPRRGAGRARPSTAEAVRTVAESDEPLGRARLPAGRRALRLPRCWPSTSRTARDNVTRFVWLAPASAGRRAPGDRAAQDLDRLLGLQTTTRRAALVAVLRELADRGDEPDEDRVAPAPGAARALHRSSPTSTGASTSRPVERGAGGASRARVEELRVLGSYPAAKRSGVAATATVRPATLAAPCRRVAYLRHSRGGGRTARPVAALPAARPEQRGSGTIRPGAGPERLLRADQRLHGPARRRADPQAARRDPRARRVGAARREPHDAAPGRHPAARPTCGSRVTPTAARSPAARSSPATSGPASTAATSAARSRRPRDPALQGRRVRLGQHRHLLRALQPPQGRPAAEPGRHAPGAQAEGPEPHALRPRGDDADPGCVASVLACGCVDRWP